MGERSGPHTWRIGVRNGHLQRRQRPTDSGGQQYVVFITTSKDNDGYYDNEPDDYFEGPVAGLINSSFTDGHFVFLNNSGDTSLCHGANGLMTTWQCL